MFEFHNDEHHDIQGVIMKYAILQQGDCLHIVLSERLTYADHIIFRKMLDAACSQPPTSCVIDLSNLDFIDSTGMGMLVLSADVARKGGFSLTLAGARGIVRRALEVAELSRIIPMDEVSG